MESFLIIDDALSLNELSQWQELVKTGQQSTGLSKEDVEQTELYKLAASHAPELDLIHCLLFDIRKGHDTEMHKDIGEFSVLFYPHSNSLAPLKVNRNGKIESVAVIANRLVVMDCTTIEHQQIVPSDETSRHSVVFKFRHKMVE